LARWQWITASRKKLNTEVAEEHRVHGECKLLGSRSIFTRWVILKMGQEGRTVFWRRERLMIVLERW